MHQRLVTPQRPQNKTTPARQAYPDYKNAIDPLGDQQKQGCTCGGGCPNCRGTVIQPKLQVQQHDDAFEQEADDMADRVVNARPVFEPAQLPVNTLSTKSGTPNPVALDAGNEASIKSLAGKGQPMTSTTRNFFEPRFGADFSDVRIHTGHEAAQTAASINARAYTMGNNVVFGAGEYAPDTTEGRRLMAHELTHTIQQRSTPSIQRKVGDGHDLTAVDFINEPTLEAVFDGEDVLRIPEAGPAVAAVQQALLDLGFDLPEHGADGKYGSETRDAVKDFQTAVGMSGLDVDGKVGKRTMGLLDLSTRRGEVVVATDADESSSGDLITEGKDPFADHEDNQNNIFFDLASAEIDAEELEKIQVLADRANAVPPDDPGSMITLHGFASEEGADEVNSALIEQRMAAVAEALANAGHHGSVVLKNRLAESTDVRFRRKRKVEVLIGDEESTLPECGTSGTTDPCDVGKVAAVRAEGDRLGNKAIRALDNPQETPAELEDAGTTVNEVFDAVFHTDNTTRDAAMDTVKSNYVVLLRTLGLAEFFCGNMCHPACRAGAAIFVPSQTISSVISCPMFFTSDFTDVERGGIFLHEGAHLSKVKDENDQIVDGLAIGDFANNFERIFELVSTQQAINMADTYNVFARLIDQPGSVSVGNARDDDTNAELVDSFDTQLDASNHIPELELAIAFMENWLKWATVDSDFLHHRINQRRQTGEQLGGFAQTLWDDLSPRFGLSAPHLIPREKDQTAVAAIHSRYRLMLKAIRGEGIHFALVASGQEGWVQRSLQGDIEAPGFEVRVSLPFFDLDALRQITYLLQELVHVTEGITAPLEPEYVAFVNTARINRGAPNP